jgi:tetratricopeptide (TPR) repeat protein
MAKVPAIRKVARQTGLMTACSLTVLLLIACDHSAWAEAGSQKFGKVSVPDVEGLLAQGQYDEALAACDAMIDRDPRDAWAHYYRGCAIVRNFDLLAQANAFAFDSSSVATRLPLDIQSDTIDKLCESAAVEFSLAFELDSRMTEALVGRAMAFTLLGKHNRALADLNAALDLDPHDCHALSARATANIRRGENLAALADFDAAIAVSPDDADLHANRAAVHVLLGKLDPALADLETALRLNPECVHALAARAGLRAILGDDDQARADYDAAIRLQPNNAMLHAAQAAFLESIGSDDEALEAYARAIEADRDGPGIVRLRCHRARGILLISQHRAYEALADLAELIANDPDDMEARELRGLCHYELRRYDRACDDLEVALRLGTDSLRVRQCFADALRCTECFEDSVAECTKLIEQSPASADSLIYVTRALAYEGLKDFESALNDYDRADALQPRDSRILTHRGRLQILRKDYPAAIADSNQAIEIDPQSARAYHNRAYAWRELGDKEQAARDWMEAQRLFAIGINRTTTDPPNTDSRIPSRDNQAFQSIALPFEELEASLHGLKQN